MSNYSPVIPAKAGIHAARTDCWPTQEQRPANVDLKRQSGWIPAKAGIHAARADYWPMQEQRVASIDLIRQFGWMILLVILSSSRVLTVIPAFAGMTSWQIHLGAFKMG